LRCLRSSRLEITGQIGSIDRLKLPNPGHLQSDEEVIMKRPVKPGFPMSLSALLFAFLVAPAGAQEPDLSCMSYRVLDKIQVAGRYKEYDVIVENRCPGAAYWTMCIERLDSRNQKILESHQPGGQVEKDKKSRVNLQMKKSGGDAEFRQRFQEFYVNVAYGIERAAAAKCVAASCEAQKRTARAEFRANLGAWVKAQTDLTARLEAECPESGWGVTEEVKSCRSGIREAAQAELARFEQADRELRERIVSGAPAYCQLYGGDLVSD
jgi:hypothetical protein